MKETLNHFCTSRKVRSSRGSAIADFAAAMCIIIPLTLTLIGAIVEVHSFILVKVSLDDAARVAARNCAMAYHWPPYNLRQTVTGTAYSPDAQGDTVAPPTTSGSLPASSPAVIGTSGGLTVGQPQCANDAFGRVRVGNIVIKNSQFSAVYTPASVNDTSNPQNQIGHVTVTVTSLPGMGPMPDPLGLRKMAPNFTLTSSSTYSL